MAIQQHPLPQDISSYRFRLIGDMTIKQFASLGISIVLAIFAYSFPLPFFFKYPLSFFFLVLGVGMAFVPIQGRSLDVWIVAFIRSIYSPTQYVWKQSSTEEITLDTTIPQGTDLLKTQPVSNASIEVSTANPAAPISVTPSVPPVTAPPPTPAPTPVPVSPSPSQGEGGVRSIPESSANTPPSPVQQLPIPYTPTSPNTLVGLTLTPDGKILDGVLVEIKKNGLTSRATKSNKLGQFMFARPLENGTFQIIAEKEDFKFTPYSLELTGEIIKPLKIQAV